jgi:hypothetical protein
VKVFEGTTAEAAREMLRLAASGVLNEHWPRSQGMIARNKQMSANGRYVRLCTAEHRPTGTMLMLTRDFEPPKQADGTPTRVIHLSLSFIVPGSRPHEGLGQPRKRDALLSHEWARLVFRHRLAWVWVQRSVTELGRRKGVWHYKLFCDERWLPVKTEELPAAMREYAWLPFSEVQQYDGVM